FHGRDGVARLARLLPRFCALLAGLAAGLPFLALGSERSLGDLAATFDLLKISASRASALGTGSANDWALGAGALFVLIGIVTAFTGRGLQLSHNPNGRRSTG